MKYYFVIFSIVITIQMSFADPPYTYKNDLQDVAKVFRDMINTDVDISRAILKEIPDDVYYKPKFEEIVKEFDNPGRNSCVKTTFKMISKFRTVVAMPPKEFQDLFNKLDVQNISMEQHKYISAFMLNIEEIKNLIQKEFGDVTDFMSVIC